MQQHAPTGEALIAKARELTPFFSAQAPLNEAQGRLTDETVAALRDNGFQHLWIPKCFGGTEASPIEGLQVVEQMSYADGSTGWVLMAWQVGTASAAGYLPASAAQSVFGNNAAPIIAGQGAPNGRADVVDGGYRLSGRWSYGSGLLHSDYIHTGTIVYENGAPRMMPGTKNPEVRIFIVPLSDATLHGNWDTLGLRATGSVDYTIDDVFVPEAYTHLQATKIPIQGGGFYRLGIQGMGAICHAAFALGVGRRMLDELKALTGGDGGKPFVLSGMNGTEAFLEHFATAEARYRSVRAFTYETWRDIEPTLARDESMTVRQTTLARLALNYLTSEIAEICSFAHKFGGGHSLRNTAMQRCFRDIHSGTQHAATSPLTLRETGRELLGMAQGKVWGMRGLIDP